MPTYRVPVRINFVSGGGPGYNVWHVRTTAGDAAQLDAALDALEAFYTAIKAYYVSTTTIVLGEGMIKDPLGSPEYVTDQSRTVTGTGASGMASHLLAICCSWRTTSATRSGRGRTFLGPLGANINDNNDGTPTAAAMTAIRAAAATLVAAGNGTNGWAIGVLSPTQGVLRDITGVTVNDKFAVLRSRRA